MLQFKFLSTGLYNYNLGHIIKLKLHILRSLFINIELIIYN